MSIDNLPTELLDILADYCKTQDLKNLARCSQHCSNMLKPILCQSIALDLRKIMEDETLPLEHLEFATKLCIDQLPLIKADLEVDVEKLSKVFGFCNPAKVKDLVMKYPCDTTFVLALRVFQSAVTLDVDFVESYSGWDWDLPDLKSLKSLTAMDMSINLDLMLKHSELMSLTITLFASDNYPVNLIAEEKGLERLCIDFAYRSNVVDLTSLSQLSNLTHLELFGLESFSQESLFYLCRTLQRLEVLEFRYVSRISDSSLGELYRLQSLKHLTLDTPQHMLSSRCLEHISMIPHLRSLTFNASICNDERAFEQVCFLNRIQSLQRVFLHVCEEAKCVEDLIAGLVHGKSWKLRYVRHYDEKPNPVHPEGCYGYYSFSSTES